MRKPGVSRGTRNMVVPCRSGAFGIGARVDEEQLADAGVGDEALLAVEDPFVAVALRAQLEAGLGIVRRRQAVVGAGARLADAFAEEEVSSARNGLRKRSFCSSVQLAAIRWLHFQHWLKVFEMALSALASSAITSAWVTKSVPWPPHSFGTAMVRKPSLEPFLMMLPVEGLARIGDLVARERDRADLLLGELARLHLPGALLFGQ